LCCTPQENVALLLSERERVAAALKAVPAVVRVCASDANFLLFEVKAGPKVYNESTCPPLLTSLAHA
jgi:histidinol-phosphate/aromatic aminotransferase/cobyric acid decarboxylase-like protein